MTGEGEDTKTPVTRPIPKIIQIPDEREEDDQPSALFPGVSGIRPKVAPEKWVKQENTGLMMIPSGMTGKHNVPRPKPLPVEPPQRFHRTPQWKSITILAIVLGMSLLSCIGLLKLGASGASLWHPRLSATPIPTRTNSPTQIPHTRK